MDGQMLKAALTRVNAFLQDFLVLFLGLVLASVGWYFVSHTTLIDRVSATEVEVSRNQALGDEIHGKLDTIVNSVQEIALDMRTVKANQESMKEDIDRLGK